MNVLLISSMEWFPEVIERVKSASPGVLVTNNYEEVLGLVKARDVNRLCIIMGGYNYSKSMCNCIKGFEAAEELHKVDATVPILIINGEQTELSSETGLMERVTPDKENERYISCDDIKYCEDYDSGKLFKDFYSGAGTLGR